MKKIIFLASYPNSLINFRLSLMQKFLSQGYSVVAVAPYDEEVKDILENLQIQFIALPLQRNGLNPFADFKVFFHLLKIFEKEKPDFIFTYTIKPIIYGSFAAYLSGVKKICALITGTGYIFGHDNLKTRIVGVLAKRMFKFALNFNHLIFFQNKDNLQLFLNRKLIAKQKCIIVNGSGVDCEKFIPVQFPQEISFLMIARILYDKGIKEYIDAAKIVKTKYPQMKFRLVGWIDSNPNAIPQKKFQRWIKEADIEYLGQLSDVRPVIAQTSVYVLPSYHEGTPRTVLEAMAMGRPIITTNVPGCKETVIDARNGLLVPAKDVRALSQAMTFFIESPEKISIMGKISRQIAETKFNVHAVNACILEAMGV